MPYIALMAVIGILFLHLTGAIPLSSVGGPMVIALALFAGALGVAIHEAWTQHRGALGWVVNIVVSFVAAFLAAQLGGMLTVFLFQLLRPVMQVDGSLAATGGAPFALALTLVMGVTLLGSWGALRIVNRWR